MSKHEIEPLPVRLTIKRVIIPKCQGHNYFFFLHRAAIYEETAEDAVTTPIPNEDTVTTPTPSLMTTVTVTTTATVLISPSSTCTPLVTAASQAASQQVVSVAIPVALVTVLIVVIVVLVGIGVCVKTRGRSSLLTRERGHRFSLSSSTTSHSAGTHYINSGTALRGVARIADSNGIDSTPQSATLKEIENELYQLNGSRYKVARTLRVGYNIAIFKI